MHTVLTGTDDLPRKLEVMKVYDRMQAAFPGGQIPAIVVVEADDVTSPQIAEATRQLGDKALATGTIERAAHRRGQSRQARGDDRHPDARRRHRQRVGEGRRRAARRHRRLDDRLGAAASGGLRQRHRGRHEGLQRPRQAQRADRVRVRAVAGVPAAAGDVPLDRHPDQGDRAEPAVGRRRLRRADLVFQDGHLQEPAGLQVQRRRS